MKRYMMITLVALFAFMNVKAQKVALISNANQFVGDTVRLCDKVISSNAALLTEDKPSILIMGGSEPENQVSIIIKAEDRKRFDYKPEKDLINRNVCVTGKLEKTDGKLQILVSRQVDINIENK